MSVIVDRWFAEYRGSIRRARPRDPLAPARSPEDTLWSPDALPRARPPASDHARDGSFWMRARRILVGPRWWGTSTEAGPDAAREPRSREA